MAAEHVLIIDDSSENIKFLTEAVLAPIGLLARAVHDGETGLAALREQQPDLILLELNLPRMAGLELLRALRAEQISTPVIVMDASGSEPLAVPALRLGAHDYLLKPLDAAEMAQSVARALAETRLRRERDDLAGRLRESNRQLERRARELHTLFDIGRSVAAAQNGERLLPRLVEAAIYLTGAEAGALLLLNETGSELRMAAARGIDDRVARAFRLPVNDSLAGQVVSGGEPLLLNGPDATGLETGSPAHSLMMVPLKCGGRVSGVFAVQNRLEPRNFTSHDLRLLSTLADDAAVALENARLLEQAESEQGRLTAIMAEIDEPVLVTGWSGEIVLVNAAFRAAFGLAAGDDLAGQPLHEAVLNPALQKFVTAGSRHNETGRAEIPLNDGRTFFATLTPVPAVGRVVVLNDVTHLKELGRLKTDFVATVSHNLHAPLNAMRDYAGMLDRVGPLNQKQSVFVERIAGGVGDLLALVDTLLDLSAIELGVDSSVVAVDVAELTRVLVGEFQEQAARNRQHLIYHPPLEPALVPGNPLRLKQVVRHLIDNALKYTPPAGQIAVLVQAGGGNVTVKVEDSGIGIPPADLPFLFDRFYRVKPDHPASGIAGAGLGLALCRLVVEKHNGHIWAESRPGAGSTFTCTLPAVPASNGLAPAPVGSPTANAAATEFPQNWQIDY